VALYSFGRLFIEQLRIDTASEFFGLRLNTFTSVALIAVATLIFFRLKARPEHKDLEK
jgi:prolipoprotein diacylglyceryltransferase